MKFTLSWLKDHLETDASLDEIVAALTEVGLEVEGVEDPASTFAAFTVAHVIEAAKHPNADKLKLCRVETAKGEMQIVCGAPNAKTGMKAVFAPEGTYIPGSGITLKPAEIRGVASNGMLCSERELELSDEHDGIIELPADAPVGASVAQVMGLDDPIIDIAITPNRQDCFGIRGVARDLAAKGLGKLKPLVIPDIEGEFESPVDVLLEAGDACPVFASRMIKGVKNGPSPDWVQRRLRAVGLRPISALVDVTNYVTMDLGRPLHVFDANKLNGNLHVRMGREGESLNALNDKQYDIDETMCVVADDSAALGLGGIIGGEESSVDENTTDVLLECAFFDPILTGATGRKLNLDTDARQRFERGADPAFVKDGEIMGAAMILKLCGGTPSKPKLSGAEPIVQKEVTLRVPRVKQLTGVEMTALHCAEILERLGFASNVDGENVVAQIPSWRRDIDGEADLVEEVVRIYGFDKIPTVSMPRDEAVAQPTLTLAQKRIRRLRRALAAAGMNEAISWAFIREEDAKAFGGGAPELHLANPISVDMSVMRPSALPGLLRAVKRNLDRGLTPVRLFEIGACFENDTPKGQFQVAAMVLAGNNGDVHWASKAKPFDVYDAKAAAELALAEVGAPVDKLMITTDAPAWFHPGRSGVLRLGPKNILGVFGELHPRLAKAFDIKGPVVMAEIYPGKVPTPKAAGTRTRPVLDLSDLQAIERDFAFIVKEDVSAEQLLKAVRGAEKTFISDVKVFDVYQGPGVEEGRKSLALKVILQPKDVTFKDEDIGVITRKIIENAKKAVDAELRA